MDLQSRKIEFVQEFLKIQSEDTISRLEMLLRKEKKSALISDFEPMTKEELNLRIEQSELDFKSKRFKSSSEILSKYE